MADINLPSIYPRGVISGSLEGIEQLLFGRNFGCSTETITVNTIGQGLYKFALDSKQILSGLYFLNAETTDGNSLKAILSVNGKYSTYDGSDSYRNGIQLLSLSGSFVLELQDLQLLASATTEIASIVTLRSNPESLKPLTVTVTQIGSINHVKPNSDIGQYTIDLDATITGVDRSAIVRTDQSSSVDLNSLIENSIIYCNPATESSRPNKSGVGMCSTFVGNGKRYQLFWSENGRMYLRSQNSSWIEISSSNKFPKPLKSGFLFAVSTSGADITIPVEGIDLTDERYSIIVTPEYDILALNEVLQISGRQQDQFTIKTINNWAGVVSYSILETRASDDIPKMNLTVGRLDGSDLRPATSVNEGQTIRFVLSTQSIPDDTSVQYTLEGVSEYDIGIPLTGNFVVKNSSAYVDVSILKDMLADGEKTITLKVSGDAEASMLLKDTSTSPVFEIIFAKDRNGLQPVSILKDGFAVYMIIKGITYDKGVTYTLDFDGSTFQPALIGSIPESLDVVFDKNDTFVYAFNFNQPESTEQVVTISSDETDLNLYSLALSRLGIIKDPSNIRFVINSGITISASSTLTSAITVGNFPIGSTITIVNNGTIVGRGGRGGYAPSSLAQSLLDGEVGGPCVNGSPTSFCIIENYGSMYSGGGGGGASGVCTTNDSTKYHPILSGGGAAPFGVTPPIMGTSSQWMGDGYSDSISEYDSTTDVLSKQWLSFNGEVFYKIGDAPPVLQNKHPVGDATALQPVKYDTLYKFRPCSPGNGGGRGLDGLDGFVNSEDFRVVIKPGKGGKAGRVINQNEYNVLIKNISGIVIGH